MAARRFGLLLLTGILTPFLTPRLLAAEEAGKDYEVQLMTAWRVKTADSAAELGERFSTKDFDDSAWQTADLKEGSLPYPDKVAFYRKWVDVPGAWKGWRTELVFEDVGDNWVVYVEGQKVGEHQGRTNLRLDVTNQVQCGAKNLIAVRCENTKGPIGIVGPASICLPEEVAKAEAARNAQFRVEMKLNEIPFKIVYESFRDKSWDLCMMSADGSNQVNLTNTPDVDELYPHVSPDGARLCCLVDETVAGQKVRNLYLMNLDGTGRTKIADNAREGCWSADGKRIAYLKAEFEKFTLTDYASKGLVIYDLATQKHEPHPNPDLHHLYNVTWTPDGAWFVSTVHGGMGFRHAILAVEANGTRVFDLGKWRVGGCRPDLSPDGKQLTWGANDETLMTADIDFGGPEPKVSGVHPVAHCRKGFETYHVDWSPDGKHVAFSYGPKPGSAKLGERAPSWNICVADLTGKWVPVTTDGKDDKEPDWVPSPAGTK